MMNQKKKKRSFFKFKHFILAESYFQIHYLNMFNSDSGINTLQKTSRSLYRFRDFLAPSAGHKTALRVDRPNTHTQDL